MAESCELNRLVRFRFGAAVLVRDLVFFEEIRHFLSHDGIIVLNGKHRDFFSHFGFVFRREVWLFWRVTHSLSIH